MTRAERMAKVAEAKRLALEALAIVRALREDLKPGPTAFGFEPDPAGLPAIRDAANQLVYVDHYLDEAIADFSR